MNFGRGQNMEDQYYFGALYGNLDYYFFYGEKPANVIDEITHLTGRTLLKPKYALGFQQVVTAIILVVNWRRLRRLIASIKYHVMGCILMSTCRISIRHSQQASNISRISKACC